MEQILKDLWKNKPVLIVVVVVVGLLVYLLWKSNQNAIIAPGGNVNGVTHTHPGGGHRHSHRGEFPIPTGGGGMGN